MHLKNKMYKILNLIYKLYKFFRNKFCVYYAIASKFAVYFDQKNAILLFNIFDWIKK